MSINKEDEVATSDYKLDKAGKKIKAHRIVFNKGEDDGKKGISEMKKKFNSFVEQHTLPLTEEELAQLETELNEVLGKDAKAGDWIHDFVHSDNPKFSGKSKEKRKQMALAAYYSAQRNEEVVKEGNAFDIKGASSILKDKSKTATMHDVKHTSTGTVYTKQRDADGNSKEFKRDPDTAKRGRGRPKKNSFGEAAEFLMSLDDQLFESMIEEGLDAFVEYYEQLDEVSKATLGSYIKKATNGMSGVAINAHQAGAAEAGSKDRKAFLAKANKRIGGIAKAADRLTK